MHSIEDRDGGSCETRTHGQRIKRLSPSCPNLARYGLGCVSYPVPVVHFLCTFKSLCTFCAPYLVYKNPLILPPA